MMPSAPLLFWLSAFFITTTYLFYPLLVALAARLRPRPVRRAPYQSHLSIVLVAYNEAPRVRRRIENLLAQAYPPERIEVIAVSDGSTDGTAEIFASLAQTEPRLRVIELEKNLGKAAALNAGVAAAGGELIVFADARQTFAADVLARLAENFADDTIGSASGELVLTDGERGVAAQVGLYWSYEKWIRKSESACGSMLGATGAIYAIRRALWRSLPARTLLDDFLIPMRMVLAGKRAIFDERALAFDRASVQGGQEFRRKARTLAGNFQAFAIEPGLLLPWRNRATWLQLWSHKAARLFVPYALIVLFFASLAAPGAGYGFAALAQALFYGLALAGWRLDRRGRPIPWRPVSLAYTFVTLNAAAVVGLWTHLRGPAAADRLWR